jgi:lipid A 4'-phosphatase
VATNQCEKNCSFVSGEASSLFAMFFGLAMVAGTRARALIAVGIALGSFAGLIRMSQGAHFLSDVVFAGIFMALTAALMRILIIELQRVWHAERAVKARADSH